MYRIIDSKGQTIAVVSRKVDAQALAQTVGAETPKKVDKLTD